MVAIVGNISLVKVDTVERFDVNVRLGLDVTLCSGDFQLSANEPVLWCPDYRIGTPPRGYDLLCDLDVSQIEPREREIEIAAVGKHRQEMP